jgi:hypothetical protein
MRGWKRVRKKGRAGKEDEKWRKQRKWDWRRRIGD